jgi:hypothetical protein
VIVLIDCTSSLFQRINQIFSVLVFCRKYKKNYVLTKLYPPNEYEIVGTIRQLLRFPDLVPDLLRSAQ